MEKPPLSMTQFDYAFSEDFIAQKPIEPRDHARLLVLRRADGSLEHAHFYELVYYLQAGDLLVVNESRVLPARLFGYKYTGGHIEVLLLRKVTSEQWEALVKGRNLHPGVTLLFTASGNWDDAPLCRATITDVLPHGGRLLTFDRAIEPVIEQIGLAPLPPYIHEHIPLGRYQTVYSATIGSAAAPTAGLHFTPQLIERITQAGIGWASVVLHVGTDTFQPVRGEDALAHAMHGEWFELPADTATRINQTRRAGGRVIAVGTTTVRVLESVAQQIGTSVDTDTHLVPMSGWTDIYIYPPYEFKLVDVMITNFHLPRSTPLLMVSAFAGREMLLHAYAEAIAHHYRFFSFGDAMLIL